MNGDTLRAEITDLDEFMASHAADRCVHVLAALFQSDSVGARVALQPMLEAAPDDPRLLALEADIWRDEGKFAEAGDRYRRLIWGAAKPSLQASLTSTSAGCTSAPANFPTPPSASDAPSACGRTMAHRPNSSSPAVPR